MRTSVVCASNLSNTSVSSHNNNWGLIAFKSSVEEGEAFNIEHVDLIDEEDTRDDLSSAFFSPFSYFLVNLLSNFRFNFSNITCKEG
jgi:hypothetical protein